MSTSVANDVWSTLGDSVTASIKALSEATVSRVTNRINKPTTSTPSTPAPANPNPFPGAWSVFPQSDTKQQFQNPSIVGLFGSINPLWIVLGGLVLLLFLVRR